MFFKNFWIFILPILNLSISADASAGLLKCQEISSAVIRIFTEQSDSIKQLEEERVYLKAERLYPTDNGLLLFNGCSSI